MQLAYFIIRIMGGGLSHQLELNLNLLRSYDIKMSKGDVDIQFKLHLFYKEVFR